MLVHNFLKEKLKQNYWNQRLYRTFAGTNLC